MAYDGRYDDPIVINAFLMGMKCPYDILTRWTSTRGDNSLTLNDDGYRTPIADLDPQTGVNTPDVTSAASSPPDKLVAPPPTPEVKITTAPQVRHLAPIREDEGLSVQRDSHSTCERDDLGAILDSGSTTESQCGTSRSRTPTYTADSAVPGDNPQSKEQAKEGCEDFVSETRENAATSTSEKQDTAHCDRVSVISDAANRLCLTDRPYRYVPIEDIRPNDFIQHEAKCKPTAISSSSSNNEDDSSIIFITDDVEPPASSERPSSSERPASSEPSVSPISSSRPNEFDNMFIPSFIRQQQEIFKVTQEQQKSQPKVVDNDESQEHTTCSLTKGAPTKRNAEASRARQVILKNLSAGADLSLVQSLIHGGAIENMKLCQEPCGSNTAYVTFVNADACQKYVERYPLGLIFKYNGRDHLVFVSMNRDVEVVSSALRFYLDCGASRVIRVVGADHDWSMRALRRLAGGLRDLRKIESIFDNYRNDVRTIVFRFTKIADAVSFRLELKRAGDWDGADVQFLPDPCEKATDIHFD